MQLLSMAGSMSLMGHFRPMHSVPGPINVRCYSNNDIIVRRGEVTLRANLRHDDGRYSITSSAVARSIGGIVKPSALAVLRLTTNSNFVGWITGKSAGFSPPSIRPV